MKKVFALLLAVLMAVSLCMVGCSEKETASDAVTSATCTELFTAATEGTELPGMMTYDPSMDEAMLSELTEYFYTGLDLSKLSDFYIGTPMMMVHASEIAIFKPVDAAAAEEIKAVIDARIEVLNNTWSTYLPDQFALVEAHKVVEEGGCILFVVAADADKIVEQFTAAAK